MINSNVSDILCGYTISMHKDTGILSAEKQRFLPAKEILMLDQRYGAVLENTNSMILTDSDFSLKGGRKL